MGIETIVTALRCISSFENKEQHCESCPFYEAERLSAEIAEKFGTDEWPSCNCDAVGFAAADLIENQQREIEALMQANRALRQRWIPVTERLPEPETYDYVLACVTEKKTRIDYRNAVVMAFVSEEGLVDVEIDCVLGGVTHWMPLPEAPEVK